MRESRAAPLMMLGSCRKQTQTTDVTVHRKRTAVSQRNVPGAIGRGRCYAEPPTTANPMPGRPSSEAPTPPGQESASPSKPWPPSHEQPSTTASSPSEAEYGLRIVGDPGARPLRKRLG